MRLAKFILPAALAALPLGAQQDAPLTVSLLYSGIGAPAFAVNRPAYVAVFSLTRSSIRQLYPPTSEQRAVYEGRATAYALGFRGSPLGHASYSRALNDAWSTILVVASTSPLRVGAPEVTVSRLANALWRLGRFSNFDTEKGMDAIIGLVASDDSNAEQVSMADEYAPTLATFLEPSPLIFAGSPGVCVRAWSFAGYFPWNLENCIYDPNAGTPVTLAAADARPRTDSVRTDSVVTKVDSAAPSRHAMPGVVPVIENPRGMRPVLAALGESAARRSAADAGPRSSGGVDVYARHFDPPAGRSRAGDLEGPDTPRSRGPGVRSRGPGESRGDGPVMGLPESRAGDGSRSSGAPRSTEVYHERPSRDATPMPRESAHLPALPAAPPPPPPASPPIKP